MSALPWKELLDLSDRTPLELYERNQPVRNSLYAGEIQRAMSKLDLVAMFCVEGAPQIAVLEQVEYNIDEISKVHDALWNQGLVSILIVMAEDHVRVFSLAKAPGDGDPQQFEDQCLIEDIKAANAAISLKNYVYGAESGRLWRDKPEHFNPKERIDSVLLRNLNAAQELLVRTGLSVKEAQAILIQTMFIAYLEDRSITTTSFFESIAERKQKALSLSDILESGDVDFLKHLFKKLQCDFNGDLFISPCSFDDPDYPQRLSMEAMEILLRFRKGREDMSREVSQIRFWGYDFKFIPVELISAVYDRFLGHDEHARRKAGAYYTPVFLANTVISSVWEKIDDNVKQQGTVLDPACGSGIFLVRTFQRFCEHWRKNAKANTIPWKSLVKMLQRVHGRDLNGIAVRVAVFSLYIALLEEVSPPDIQKIAEERNKLPSLWGKTLMQRDFFDEETEVLQVDMIVGNPPWISRRNTKSSGAAWCDSRNLPMPRLEEAWAFTWKASHHLSSQGIAAFLLPAMGFLHNHTVNSVETRVRFFEETRVSRVVNFSDLRRQLFDSTTHATALIIFQRGSFPNSERDYKFEYWTPKVDLNLAIRRFITISEADKSKPSLSSVRKNPSIFKQRLWMSSPEEKLFNYLNSLPKINSFVKTFRSIREHGGLTRHPWAIGRGFGPYNNSGENLNVGKPYESSIITNYKHLPIDKFTLISIGTSRLTPLNKAIVRRKGFEGGFAGTRVLVPRGVSTASMRLRAAYIEEPITFEDNIQAITGPAEENERAKFITAVLNSRLSVWYSFHGTASFGSSRPQVGQSELLKLPMPEPKHLASPKKARFIRKKLVALIDHHRENRSKILKSPNEEDNLLSRIDSLTYDYFGLSDEERTLIEDSVDYILPSAQPSAGSFANLRFWNVTFPEEREAYAKQLVTSLSSWFDGDWRLSARLIAFNKDFGILRLQLHDVIGANGDAYTENSSASFSKELISILDASNSPVGQNFRTILDLRIFIGKSLFLIKPMQRRFWLRSTALADVDSIVSELETIIMTDTEGDAIS